MKALLGCAIAIAAVAASTTFAPSSRAGRSPACSHGLVTVRRNPRGLLPLTANPVGPAAKAALRYTRPSERPQVTKADLATADNERGGEAKFDCGVRAWRRTVVVYVLRRADLPSESTARAVFFVGRFRDGYRVWQVVH